LNAGSAEHILNDAPFGLFASFLINQLPSFMKPSNFISFTEYLSLLFAAPGEGIGSSPMLEAYLSSMASLAFAATNLALVFFPAFYFRRWPALRLFTYCLGVAIFFNFWRIGSAEILKMYLSGTLVLLVSAKTCGFRVLAFKSISRKSP
jgi:hypothetical protein